MQREQVRIEPGPAVLGDRARWGKVGYAGQGFAPAPDTYPGLNAARVALTTIADSGRCPVDRQGFANLYPIAAAALYEVAFAREAGPLATWRN
jgi:hypothetical protein